MSVGDGWRFGICCMVVFGAIAVGRAQTATSKPINDALTLNGDGAQRSKNIHWPNGFHLEQADLFAHNEVVVHASCEKVSLISLTLKRGRSGIRTPTMCSC
jgi:hypothetical protein